ncbi:MAG: NHL repeat-containing protein [Planctomycetota bacterium]
MSFKRIMALSLLTVLLEAGIFESLLGMESLSSQSYAAGKSDLNGDGHVDIDDVAAFSSKWLKTDYRNVDWCRWLQQDDKTKKHMGQELINFILVWFDCDKLIVVNNNHYPARLAYGPQGRLFVSDSKVGSVFIYDTGMYLTGELKGIDQPLGVAVDKTGNIYVGSNGSDTVRVYDSQGQYMRSTGSVGMPNDMVFDLSGNLYVADSVNNKVNVYDLQGNNVRTISANTPIALAIRPDIDGQGIEELYVAEMGLSRISVFDLQGNRLRSIGRKVGVFGSNWHGRFVKLQSLAIDSQGRVHALDCYMNKVQILDPQTGAFIASYPSGEEPDHINLLLDIAIRQDHQTAATNHGLNLVEIIGGW